MGFNSGFKGLKSKILATNKNGMTTKSGVFSWFTEHVNDINMILQGRGYLVSSIKHSMKFNSGKST